MIGKMVKDSGNDPIVLANLLNVGGDALARGSEAWNCCISPSTAGTRALCRKTQFGQAIKG